MKKSLLIAISFIIFTTIAAFTSGEEKGKAVTEETPTLSMAEMLTSTRLACIAPTVSSGPSVVGIWYGNTCGCTGTTNCKCYQSNDWVINVGSNCTSTLTLEWTNLNTLWQCTKTVTPTSQLVPVNDIALRGTEPGTTYQLIISNWVGSNTYTYTVNDCTND